MRTPGNQALLIEAHTLETAVRADIFAIDRVKAAATFPAKVTDKEKEQVVQRLHKIHKNIGHPPNIALAKILQRRGAKPWVAQLALKLTCDIM